MQAGLSNLKLQTWFYCSFMELKLKKLVILEDSILRIGLHMKFIVMIFSASELNEFNKLLEKLDPRSFKPLMFQELGFRNLNVFDLAWLHRLGSA